MMDFSSISSKSHQSFSKTIALWVMWAACNVVNLVELHEVVELPGTVAWAIVTLEYEWMSRFCEDHSQFFDHCMCGSFLTIKNLVK